MHNNFDPKSNIMATFFEQGINFPCIITKKHFVGFKGYCLKKTDIDDTLKVL